MTTSFDPRKIPNGTVLVLGIRHEPGTEPGGDTRGRTKPVTLTYAALKTGGLWYLTGAGQVPTAAGWGAVERWLGKANRKLVHVDHLTRNVRLWDELDHLPADRPTED